MANRITEVRQHSDGMKPNNYAAQPSQTPIPCRSQSFSRHDPRLAQPDAFRIVPYGARAARRQRNFSNWTIVKLTTSVAMEHSFGPTYDAGRRQSGSARPTVAEEPFYAQVQALAAADRAEVDILATTRESTQAVIELRADEAVHVPCKESIAESLPTQLLSWHPTTDTILRYLLLEMDWEPLEIDQGWREELRVVFRKRPTCPRTFGNTSLRAQIPRLLRTVSSCPR